MNSTAWGLRKRPPLLSSRIDRQARSNTRDSRRLTCTSRTEFHPPAAPRVPSESPTGCQAPPHCASRPFAARTRSGFGGNPFRAATSGRRWLGGPCPFSIRKERVWVRAGGARWPSVARVRGPRLAAFLGTDSLAARRGRAGPVRAGPGAWRNAPIGTVNASQSASAISAPQMPID